MRAPASRSSAGPESSLHASDRGSSHEDGVRDTIVARATPPGIGAIAMVRLSGPNAFEVLR
ncbi:MAG: hypothetical protein GWM92_10590, partial [Gemmatimonadetes bacterium]|nr:hypothetical protein [Gemmatimonadota bacterium]NIR79144.1 hypothetical protein [Gemmatimonadota bacterium]NIT87797.1 hypothetical protein [Gemmatimonadota bacterium]NIU31660.1 hypothetical protein [Gemmatimonadota bacterium]NIU36282.1 hypothetical protein [Gemmatimonadota bacterium]